MDMVPSFLLFSFLSEHVFAIYAMNTQQLENSFSLLLPELVALLSALTESDEAGDMSLIKQVCLLACLLCVAPQFRL